MDFITSVCVYCGSGLGRDPAHEASAKDFGRLLAENGVKLVYGGGGHGLMGTVARAVLDSGGHVTGIIPDFLVRREAMLESVQEHIVVEDMHTRKRLMFERADAFLALPGGIGTLEELVEQLTWAQLGRHEKPVVLANIGGYWDPLLAMFEHMKAHTFIRESLWVPYHVADRVEDILPVMEEAARKAAARREEPAPVPLERM
jgi:uncharacterized protein (TIGR00730 family)